MPHEETTVTDPRDEATPRRALAAQVPCRPDPAVSCAWMWRISRKTWTKTEAARRRINDTSGFASRPPLKYWYEGRNQVISGIELRSVIMPLARSPQGRMRLARHLPNGRRHPRLLIRETSPRRLVRIHHLPPAHRISSPNTLAPLPSPSPRAKFDQPHRGGPRHT